MSTDVRALAAIVAALAAACSASAGDGGGGGAPDARPGGVPDPDAAAGGSDAGPNDCLPQVPGSYGIATAADSSQFSGEGSFYVSLYLVEEPFQLVTVALHDDMGVFAGGVVEPGTYTIEGDEADYSWCGACVYLSVDDDGMVPSIQYMARTGKVVIDSVGAEVHGELTSIELRQIEHDYTGGPCVDAEDNWLCGNNACSNDQCGVQDEVGDCETAIASLPF